MEHLLPAHFHIKSDPAVGQTVSGMSLAFAFLYEIGLSGVGLAIGVASALQRYMVQLRLFGQARDEAR